MNNESNLTMRVLKKLDLQEITRKDGTTSTKREVVFVNDDQYPKKIVVEIWNENEKNLKVEEGKVYDIWVDFDAREWNGRWFNSIRLWRVMESADGICSTNVPKPIDYGKGETPREQELLKENNELKDERKFYQDELHKSQTAQATAQPNDSLPF